MELLNTKTLPQFFRRTDQTCYLSVAVDGGIGIYAGAARLMGLATSDRLGFALYEGQLYVIPHDPDGYELRSSRPTGGSLIFTHAQLAERIIKLMPREVSKAGARSYRILIAKKGESLPDSGKRKAFAVITSSAVPVVRRQKS